MTSWEEAAALAQRLAALPEARMRVAALAVELGDRSSTDAAWVLEALIRGALRRHAACLATYDALVDPEPLGAARPPEAWSAMLEAARAAGYIASGQWLRGVVQPDADEPNRSIDPTRLVAFALRDMTLGDRRALARRATGDALTQLASDPDGGVIHNLLNNPRTTEALVLTIVSRRPTVPEPLRAVVRAPRWLSRYKVKLGLVRNPYLELRFGLNLLVYLQRPDLEDVRADEALSGILRLGCQRLLDLAEAPLGS